MPDEQRLDVARAAIRETYMLTIGSHQPWEVESQQELLGVALRAIAGTTTAEDLEVVQIPLRRGYGRADDTLGTREDFEGTPPGSADE